MIYPRPLTVEQRRRSQKNYLIFASINGVAYRCLGETVLILFAVKLSASNALIALLGCMLYFAYLMLPLGKAVAARVGAARSQATFWTLRNFAALGVAAGSLVAYAGYRGTALAMVILGAFVFYGFRAAGVVMAQPLLGEIAVREELAELTGRSTALFYAGSILSLLAIMGILALSDSIWVLTGIIVAGASLGVFSARFIRRIDETSALRESARRPLWNEMRAAWRNRGLRGVVAVSATNNLAVVMLISPALLAVKRGYGVDDTRALFFSIIQFFAAAAISFAAGRLINRFGSRRVIRLGFLAPALLAVLWILAPDELHGWFAVAVFTLAGCPALLSEAAIPHYFLAVTPTRQRVAASLLTATAAGVAAGALGAVLSSGLFRLIACFARDWEALRVFQVYYLVALLLLLPAAGVVLRLPEAGEKR